MKTIWIKHTITGGVAEVPEEAVRHYRQSGWDVMSDEAVDEMEKAAAAELAGDQPATPPPAAADPATDHKVTPDAVARPSKKENG